MCLNKISNISANEAIRKFEKRRWKELRGGAVCVHVVTGMHRKFNGGSRCDIGQENNKSPPLVVDLA